MIVWNFEPYCSVRSDLTAEVVFTKKWQQLMMPKKMVAEHGPVDGMRIIIDPWFVDNEPESFPVLEVFKNHGIPNEHDTRIASNFIWWLGTNAGFSYREQVYHIAEKGVEKSQAFLFAWVHDNVRVPIVNHGSVPKDYLAAPFSDASRGTINRNFETLERVALWLGTDAGQMFVQSCDRNISIKRDRERTKIKQFLFPAHAPQ